MFSTDTLAPSSDPSHLSESTSSIYKEASTEVTAHDEMPENWQGWAELENDPAIFSTLLQEWGVPSVQVREMLQLDELLTMPADQVCGLILLARWTASEKNDDDVSIPEDLWFANQVSAYSCASIAIMNIINNRPDLDLGKSLNLFRADTLYLSPKERGIKLDSFDFVRNVHNSFATAIDKLNVEQLLKDDVVKWERKIKAEAKTTNGHRRKRRRVTMDRKRKITSDDYSQENGFHFIAYAPRDEALWKMDGLEVSPRRLTISDGENWLFTAAADLQAQMEMAEANGFEFSLMALVKREAGVDASAEMEEMGRVREDWGSFMAHMVRLHADRGDIKDLMT